MCSDLAVIVNIFEPEITNFVGDHILDIKQAQHFCAGHLLNLLAQAAVGYQLVRRDKECEKFVVALEWKHTAIKAVDRGNTPEEGQVGHEQLLDF